MKTLKEDFLKIFHTERGALSIMVINFLLSLLLTILSFVSLNPDGVRNWFGYGDLVSYREGSWTDLLVFPVLAILFGVVHNLLALRIFHKRGSGMAKFFLIITTCLILGTLLLLGRLVGEA